jgi:hypothetical protein
MSFYLSLSSLSLSPLSLSSLSLFVDSYGSQFVCCDAFTVMVKCFTFVNI